MERVAALIRKYYALMTEQPTIPAQWRLGRLQI